MVKCSAPFCDNASYRKIPEITFHRFPKDYYLKNAWLSNMKREHWQPKSSSVLCSKHFETNLLDHSGFRTVLAPSAIPSIFDSPRSTKFQYQLCQEEVVEDTDNFMRHRFVGGRLFLKKNVLPHKFSCQRAKSDVHEQSAFAKRRRTEFYSQVLSKEAPVSDDNVENGAASKNQSNDNVQCTSCDESITGCVYTCVQCAYTLCAACDMAGAHAHHYVLRAPLGRPMEEAVRVRATVLEVLSSLLAQNDELQTDTANASVAHTEIVIKEEELDIVEHDPLERATGDASAAGTSQLNLCSPGTEVTEPLNIKIENEAAGTNIKMIKGIAKTNVTMENVDAETNTKMEKEAAETNIKMVQDPDGARSHPSLSIPNVAVKSEPAEYEMYTEEEAIVPRKRKRKEGNGTEDLAD